MLPLPGQPRLVMLGREVQFGSGYADLVAVDVYTGRPVVIEVKLAANADRRSVFAQVLGYAPSFLQAVTNDRLDVDLVTVTAYDVQGSQVLVPQLVEPERVSAATVRARGVQRDAKPMPGSATFRGRILG